MPLYLGNHRIEDVEVSINHKYADTVTELAGGGVQHTLIADLDLSQDTVTPQSLMRGYTAHDASGTPITGVGLGKLTVRRYSTYTTSLFGYYSGVNEIEIDLNNGTNGSQVSVAYLVFTDCYGKITYKNCPATLTTSTSSSDVLRQIENVQEIDFGGMAAPATLTRFYYNISHSYSYGDYTVYIKNIDFSNVTTFNSCFAMSGNSPDSHIDVDVDWSLSTVQASLSIAVSMTKRSMLELFNHLSTQTTGTLSLKQMNLDKLTAEEIAIATAKGWTVTA